MTSDPRSGQGRFSSERQQLLKVLLRDKGVKTPRQAPIARRSDPGAPARLSFAQQRLWIIDRLKPGSASYNIPVALRLHGPLDVPALLAAMAEVVRRHEALRTTFAEAVENEGTPLQVVHPPPDRIGAVVDLAALPAVEWDRELWRLATEEASRPFDLERGPLFRLFLIRLGHLREAEHAFLLTMHHIVSDGWSAGVFVREMTALYKAFAQGQPSPLPELAIQYPDFAEWQRSWLSGDRLEEQLRYWREQLAGAPPALDLPTDRPHPAMPDGRGGVRTFDIDQDVAEALNALCRREGSTLFMALLAVFGAVLGRHAGQRDVVVGSPIANRNRAEIEGLIGFFVNSLALRVDLAGDPTFIELLARARRVANGAYAHQDLPFERLVEELSPERELGRNPVFQVMLALQNAPPGAADIPGLTLESLEMETGAAQFDLLVDFFEHPEGLAGRIGYALELFDTPTVDRLVVHFANLLAAVAAAPDLPLSRLSFLSEAERHQLELEWGTAAPAPDPGEESVLDRFEVQAARSAGGIAVRRGDVPEAPGWTYAELDRTAGAVAERLRELGVEAGVRVGLLAGRTPAAVAAPLGIWKAGGVYVPLDPAWPAARLELLLGDSGVRVLLTQEPLLERLADVEHGAEVVVLEEAPSQVLRSAQDDDGGRIRPRAGDLAYFIYTSGTTGTPKAVMVEHGSLLHTMRSVQALFGFEPGDAVTCLSPFTFDVSFFELLAPLLAGGTLVLMDLRPAPDLGRLTAVLERVDVFHAVPALMRQVVETVRGMEPERFTRLRAVCMGGEAVPPRLLEELAEVLPGARPWVLYGPTEATIFATAQEVRDGDAHRSWPGTWLGRPLPGFTLRVLDPDGEPVPAGVAGELYLGGPSVARGYLGREALTAERFVEVGGGRFYRTGDLARFLPDGRLIYLGRVDDQVKVRGFRIELGEVEATLAALPGVRQAAVVARGEGADRRLAAFVVLEGEVDPRRLRDGLRTSLPEYMVPGEVVAVDALPLSPTGKVDRRALAGLAPQAEATAARYVAPRTANEQLVAQMWAELLGVETLGAHDSFFDLGGHSLLATRVVSRVRELFDMELPLRALFEEPTVGAFAARIEAARREAQGLQAPPIVPVPRPSPDPIDLPLSFAQERLWLFDRIQPGLPAYNIPQATRWRGPLRVEVLERVLDEIVGRHESLRTRIGLSATGEPVQVIEPERHVPVPVVDLQALPWEVRETEAGRQAEVETWRPFDLVHGPVLRACVLRLAPGDHVTVFTRHHIAFDGWSNEVFSRELAALYDAFSQGEPSPLPPLPVQYADFAIWQRRWLSGEVLERQVGWWRERLAGAPALLQIPTDRPRPAVQDFRGVIATLPVPVPRLLAVEALCRREGVTPFMALLAAWKLLLSRYGAGTDLVVGSPVANRHRIEVEGLIGFFANTMVLRTDLSGDPTVRELLGRVRETALGAYEHQDTPFEKLIEELRPERSLSHTPLFQVLFAMNELGGDGGPEAGPAALSSELFSGSQAMSRYDLELYVFRGTAFLELALEYRVDLFDRTRIDRMLEHLSNLLAAMVADPGLPVSRLSFLSEPERHQLLVDWNDTGRGTAPAADLFGLVAAQADRTPDKVALVWGEERRTYGGLRGDAGRLAGRLRALGVGPEVRVGVCLERTPLLVEALLAVLAAGGAYVPLDPNYPAERLAFMREDSRLAVLVTESHLAAKLGSALPSSTPVPTVILSAAKDLGGGRPNPQVLRSAQDDTSRTVEQVHKVVAPLLPGNLAYVLYTSGSTGQPKAVAVEHRSATALVAWAAEVFTPGELDGVLASTSIAFDLAVFELFVTLSRGGKVVLAPDALHLPSLPAAGEVTLVNTVPSVLAELLRMASLPASVQVVNLAGEPLPSHLVEEAYAQPSVERVLNLYGPSEDTTYSTWVEVPRGSERAPSIGRPVAGTRVYLLDSTMQPVPAGVPGEICLAGAGLARGYLGRSELTTERFVPDPFGALGDRLYRTGDLARYRPDGEIEFLGRLDHQVKVRGFRIELGEIEAALRRHPGVRDVAVVVHQDAGGDRRLVACCVPEGREPAAGELRSFLQKRLPEAMLPSAFLMLPALPLTPNGKVDREALSQLAPAPRRPRSAEDVGTLSATEERVAGIWREVLGLPEVGVEESFFALGGHSLLATRVASRLREAFGVELPVRTLFEATTVRELARVVELEVGVVEPASAVPMPFHLLDRHLRPVPAGVPGEVWLGGVHPGAGGSDRFAPDPTTPGAWLYRTDEIARLRADGTLEILTQRVETVGEADAVPLPVPVPRDGSPLPLSFAQERLWFLDRLEPGGSMHNMPFALAAHGRLEPARLDAVLYEVVRRHETLRTTFDEQEGRPIQVIAPPSPVRLPQADLATLPAAPARAEAERLAAEEARRPFDLRRGPLLRGALLRLSSREEGDEHVLLLDMHHIVTDGWSLGVLVGEVSALYRASLAGEPSPLPELPIQYADFAVWQREQWRKEGMERQLAFWRERLAGAPAVLDLPADRPRPAVQSFRGGRVELVLGPGPVQGLRRLGGRHGATLFMTLLAGAAALLQRLTGQDDLVIGTPIANRNRLATERLIGFFVNSLALRQDLADDPAVGALLERARDTALAAYDHQDLPFERLVEELRPERHLSHQPIFQVMLALQNAPSGAIDLPGLTLESFGFEVPTAQFDLELTFEEVEAPEGEALALTLGYAADLFDAPTARRLAGQLVTLLEGLAAAEPERRTSGLPLLTGPERHQLALEWNDPPWREAPAGTLHRLVEAQAELRPDTVALMDDGEFLTYGELVRRAGRLAAALGIRPEERIGIRLPNTFERVIALLAVLRAGGAYVPLDPTYPAERLAFLVRDSGAKVVLDELPPLPETPFTPPAVLPGQAAYVTYTSGSTGVPNGVVTTHRGAVSFVVQASRLEGLEPGVRLPQIASFGFDASVLETFLALANGGALVRVPEEERLAPGELADRLIRHEVTALSITPALLATLPEPRLRGVRYLYVGGDACLADLPPRWAPGRRFYNCYGPTETTVFALTGLYGGEAGVPPIGRPLGGARAYGVDRDMRQVPVGVPGEMALGGPSLARGYLGLPALTAERFIPDPFGEPGSRLYRTGDLVRQLPDGRFGFLGRLDGQVKLRGMRIETGEVEAVLAGHPEVREAVVTARDDSEGKRLVAYVVRREEVGEDAEAAAEHVQAWRTLYDETYGSGSEFTGWNSSYTGQPIPEEEMREWADAAAVRILALRPRRVLEVGCGTGILLRRVAPHVERYHGTDFSRVALDRLRPEAGRLGATLEERAADDWSGIEPGGFDLVVLNSVSQYFPGVEYLVRVLRGAARAVAPGGAVFVGDVRSLPLLEEFALSVEQAVAPAGISGDELRRRVLRRVADEEELVVDPALFHALAESTPAVRRVEVLGKSGRFDNEMTRFRYDVVLHVGAGADGETGERPWSAWANAPLRARLTRRLVPRLRQFLRERLPEYMVPSAFVTLDTLPITPHGKVDRTALPAPPSPDSGRSGDYQAPRDPVEADLAEAWAELLGAERVGVLDNFFDLGGHSLLATQVISRVRDRFGVELPVRALFEEPTVAGLASRLREERAGVDMAPIAPVPRDGSPLPLSFAQERLWFLDRLALGGSNYNMPFALAAHGRLEPARLDAVLSEVVRRHESLRTTFAEQEGWPVQVIAPPSPVRLPLVDLAALPAVLARAEAERLASEEARRPFDLRCGPLLRGALLRLGSREERDEHVLLLDMHHIVSDGWSIGVLVGEVSALYRASVAGEPSPLPELPIQYADFAVRQRERLGEEEMERQLAFWRERLAGAPAVLDLPADRPRPVTQSFRGGAFELLLGAGPTQGLRRLAGRYGATLFVTLLGGAAAMLQRLTGQDDLVIGMPIANRNHLATERLIGFFVNSLALRLDLAGDPAVSALLERGRATALAAYEHQDLPFERLVEELRPERNLSYHPVFQVMLALQNAPRGAIDLPGLTLEPFGFAMSTAKFDLELSFWEVDGPQGGDLLMTLGYAADLFDAVTVQRLSGQLATLLEGLAAAEPEQRISGLPLLTGPEGHQLALEWNDLPRREASAETLHGIVEAQAELRPDAVALLDDGEALTYGELMRRAGRLAAVLSGLGVGPEVRVGLRLPNSFERVIALLAVLRAGGAYVPLEPTYPAERLAFMVQDSGAEIVLDNLPPLPETPFTPPVVLPDQAAYVTYTSGSTGVPNGVVTTHRAAVSFTVQASRLEGLDPGVLQPRMPMIASFGFDASVLETFLTLANGGVLLRVPEEERLAPDEFVDRLVRHEATTCFVTPAMLATLPEPRLRSLRYLYVGGDAVPADLPPRWAPGRRFFNCYGPTETTVLALTGLYEGEAGAPPIGRPLGGTRAYAVDRELHQVPIGVPGELVIGGPGLARGYLGRPGLTAARFIPDPFGEPGDRLYRTGDLVRQLPDGRFEFLGRLDGQVKLRGIRIETGEVEATLAGHPEVREAVVIARDDPEGKRLVAYVVRREEVREETETAAEHVEAWRALYDETYGSGSEFTGWNSSYTGLPIPEEEMREWADNTVARILALRPRRVLEVGCGTGILLRRVAPHVERYHGTDFSRVALDRLHPEADRLGATLEERAADDWSGIEPGSFDLVVLNSVSQYFPGVEYLVRVLRGAARAVAPGGAVLVGDVRSLPLLEEFALSVEQAIAPAGISGDELRQRVHRRMAEEEELVVDPDLFHALAESTPEVHRVEVLGKSGRFNNEMTRFRYDVVLHVGAGADGETGERPWSAWANDPLRARLAGRLVPELRRFLRERLPEYMVPSAFVLLDALPLTTHGKVDRATLPAPTAPGTARAGGAYQAPRDPVEAELAEVWAELLGAERVGVLDNFFDLGGHSLLATQVISRARDHFGVDLPVRALFEEPTVAGLAARIREEKTAASGTAAAPVAPIAPIPRDGSPLPLSFAQERLWFLDRLVPGGAIYNMPFAFAAHGRLEPARLDAVLSEVVRRHEALRTTFDEQEGRPVQVVASPAPFRLPQVDLAALPAALSRAEAERLAAEEARQPFDLRRGPLLRGVLLRSSRDEHVLLLDMHHIVSDGWSLGVLVNEVSALYRASLAGEPLSLPELPIQYADFAVWQREHLGDEEMERQLAFWRERLAGAPAVLDLPADRPRPIVQSFRGGRVGFLLGPGPTQGLLRLGWRYGVTLFMSLLGGGAALLQRLTGQEDLVIGTPIANRNHLATERLIGFFVNSLALRQDLADDPTVGALLERARDTALAAYDHQDLPFERLVEELRPERHLSHHPVFQVMLALQNAPGGAVDLPGLILEPFGGEVSTAKLDLELTFYEVDGPGGEALVGTLGYAADLFDAATVQRLAAQLVTLLEGLAAAGPERRISGLSLLTGPERHQLALEWNDSPRREARAGTLHGLVEAQAELRPDAVALVDDGEALTYGELVRRAGRLAVALSGLGVEPEELVGLRLPNTFERVIALLAVLRAGGAYVPLDPTYPAERLAFLVRDSGAKIVLDELPPLPETPFTPPAVLPEQAAYVTYTSGSTGIPNGVVTTHRGAVSFVVQASRLEGLEPGVRLPQIASFGFDASVLEIFLALANGGALVRVPEEERLVPEELADRLVRHEATALAITPALLATLPEPRLRGVRHLYVGGDACPADLPSRWAPGRRFYNCYGPTETTVFVLAGLYGDEAGAPPIGRPLGGMRAHAVDRELRQVPVGVPGELVIGGPGLARGYLGRPALTAGRFIPDPLAAQNEPGGRLYRTGDLVRQLPDGRFEFLGRLDGQVKLRGMRIETGEVEAALAGHPEVREAVVIARDEPAGKRLVAYVVRQGEGAGTAELRRFLRERLPEYMVPSAFVMLDTLPVTPHGKVDRAALPAPDTALADEVYEAPRDPVEAELAEVWAELLSAGRIGVLDNFFDLGGHSLLATQVVSRVRDRFGVELPVRVLFEEPTVAGLADHVRRAVERPPSPAADAGTPTPAPPLAPVPRDGSPMPLSFAQERLWFLDRLVPDVAIYNMPFSLRLSGLLPLPVLAASLAEVVRRHEALRTRFAVVADRPVQVIDPPSEVRLPVVDLAGLPEGPREQEARQLAAAEAARRFDLEAGPMLRAGLLRLAPDDHILLLTLHHIASDGWSMGVLARELEALLPAFAAGRPSPLPPLPVQYADYAVWQRRWLSGAELERQLGYWRERLAGAPAVLSLPLDRPRPPVRSFRGGRRGMALPDALLNRLAALGRSSGASLFMILLAVWKALLTRVTGEDDLVVGAPIANRHRQELEGLIGFFVNTLVLRTDLGGDPSFLEVLARVRETALGAYAHQDLPFERLVEELAPERSLRHNPLFQVLFTLDETSPALPSAADPAAEAVDAANQVARFDLTLAVQRGPSGGGAFLGYNTDLFRDDTAERLLGYVQRLLGAVAAEPERRLSELPLLSEAERHQLLRDWNDTAQDQDTGALLHELFERWAAATPDAAAIVLDDVTVTYGELDRRAERLAARLAGMGIGPDDRVSILMRRSAGLVTAVLAVLKAGGAWVPLDLSHPEERRELMLRDSGARVLITEETMGLASHPVVPSPLWSPDQLAYVIYTSGSTGTPNGVMVTHRGAVERIQEAREMFAVGPESRVLQVLSPGFDAWVLETFLALAHGACLCLASDEERLTPPALMATLERQGVTTAVLTPSVLSLWPEERLDGLRDLSLGGEACPADLAARWSRDRRLLNVYGPTETTIFASYEKVHGDAAPPIGRPAANTPIHLLDRALRPVGLGVAGEIAIGGVGIARGYLGRPERTAERFIPDPWSDTPGARLYRSGDLARLLPDGRIEFLGRIDQQVKVRGYRIEPGEIEAALRLHLSVLDAAVLVREGRTGDPELAGYVVLANGSDPAALRPFLEERLPVYMVPPVLVALPALPITPNGKLDRRALARMPLPGESHAGRGRTEPDGPVERFVADLFKEVLRLDVIGLEESFFELGGTSLQAAILINLLQERLGEYVYVVALFDAPSAAELAVYLEREYPAATARLRGEAAVVSEEQAGPVTPEMLEELRRIVPPLASGPAGPRNRRAVFILSPPRSGSTLLRVLLAGHPDLFAPPELELLGFNTLGERRDAFSGRYAFWREGAVRAWMEVRGIPAEEAFHEIEEREVADLPVRALYRQMQELVGDRLLIDKTPSYALDPATLARAEEDFEEPLYIHLLRHPYGMIASFEKAHLEQVFFRHPHPFPSRRLAELIWTVSHQNIQAHLERIPRGRRHFIRFEDLVRDPRSTLERLCAFLGVELDPAMLDPYDDKQRKMTDGVHELSRMVGDVRFHEHQRIDPAAAESWRSMYEEDFLGEPTREMAASLGYEAQPSGPASSPSVLVPLRPGDGPPLFLVHPVGGNILCYGELARRLRKIPAYGLQAAGLEEGREPHETVEEMAECYLDAVRRAAPCGPYRLMGWSFGGLVAFEMARRLSEAGETVEKLVLLDTLIPGAVHLSEPDDSDLLAGLALDLGGLAGVDLRIAPADLKGLDAEAGLARVLERARDMGALPPGIEAGAVRLWRVYRANARAARAYRPQPYDGRLVVLAAEANPLLGRLGLALGWQRFAAGVAAKTLPADHYGLLRPPVVRQIAEKLSG